jgi:hypothetical protein
MATSKEKAPDPNITIKEIKAPGVIHETDHLEKSGDMIVEEFKPTEEDLARLAKSKASPVPMQAEPAPEVAAPAVLVAPSRAKQTLAEMERGAQIVKERTAFRERMLAAQG